MWAGDNNIIPRELVVKWLYSVKNNRVVMNARPYYPMFGTWNGNANQTKVWKPEKNNNPGHVPHPNTWVAICRSSCYTPDQEILTESGYIPIGEAEELQHPEIVTLSELSTMEAPSYQTSTVEKYTASFQDTLHVILKFETASGLKLKVTPNHPLVTVDGTIEEAITFRKEILLSKKMVHQILSCLVFLHSIGERFITFDQRILAKCQISSLLKEF